MSTSSRAIGVAVIAPEVGETRGCFAGLSGEVKFSRTRFGLGAAESYEINFIAVGRRAMGVVEKAGEVISELSLDLI